MTPALTPTLTFAGFSPAFANAPAPKTALPVAEYTTPGRL